MKTVAPLMSARIFMGTDCSGEHKCASCGRDFTAGKILKKAVKPTFVNLDELMLTDSLYICESCESVLNDPDSRFKAVYYPTRGQKQLPVRDDVLKIIADPGDEWVLSVPYSFKKHHWLYAGLSNRHHAYIGTDSRTVVLDYDTQDIRGTIETVYKMLTGGIPRQAIIQGYYSTTLRYKFPWIEDYEKLIAPYRPGGALELFVTYTPATKEKSELEGKAPMITENERTAAKILYNLATASRYRATHGMEFWGGFFSRRVERYKHCTLHEFVSKMATSVDAWMIDPAILDRIDDDESVMQEIRKKTPLIIALAYTMIKEDKQNA